MDFDGEDLAIFSGYFVLGDLPQSTDLRVGAVRKKVLKKTQFFVFYRYILNKSLSCKVSYLGDAM